MYESTVGNTYYQLYIWSILGKARNQVLISLMLIDAV